jgi:hypothetical protein
MMEIYLLGFVKNETGKIEAIKGREFKFGMTQFLRPCGEEFVCSLRREYMKSRRITPKIFKLVELSKEEIENLKSKTNED